MRSSATSWSDEANSLFRSKVRSQHPEECRTAERSRLPGVTRSVFCVGGSFTVDRKTDVTAKHATLRERKVPTRKSIRQDKSSALYCTRRRIDLRLSAHPTQRSSPPPCDSCRYRTSGRWYVSERRSCTWCKQSTAWVACDGANVACCFGNWSDAAWEPPW